MDARYPLYDEILDYAGVASVPGAGPGVGGFYGQHDHAMRALHVAGGNGASNAAAKPEVIHVSEPVLLGREVEYVNDCLAKVHLSQGEYVARLELAFAEMCGVEHGIACVNGTAALHLTLLALGVRPGDGVLVPALSYVATANVVRYCGAEPIFCDVDPRTWCIDADDARKRTQEWCGEGKVRGAIAVHLYGHVAEVGCLRAALEPLDVWVVEDAAQAHGAVDVYGHQAGGLGEMAAFSFYGSKILTCGEGGMVTTNSVELAETARLYRGQGQPRGAQYFHTVVGYNYRMTEMQAAIGLAQLECFEEHARRRRAVMAVYALDMPLGLVEQQYRAAGDADWMYACLLPAGVDRDAVCRTMDGCGVETRPFFRPLVQLPPYMGGYQLGDFPVTEDVAARGVNLPTHAAMTAADVRRVIGALEEALDGPEREKIS